MFLPQPSDEHFHKAIIPVEGSFHLGCFGGEVDDRVDADDGVEDGFGEVHFPLIIPGVDDFVLFFIGVKSLFFVVVSGESDFFFVHGEYVDGLSELDALASPYISNWIDVYHQNIIY